MTVFYLQPIVVFMLFLNQLAKLSRETQMQQIMPSEVAQILSFPLPFLQIQSSKQLVTMHLVAVQNFHQLISQIVNFFRKSNHMLFKDALYYLKLSLVTKFQNYLILYFQIVYFHLFISKTLFKN